MPEILAKPLALLFAVAAALVSPAPSHAGPVEVYYAPAANLERIDVETIRSAKTAINMAAFILTDWPVIDALNEARRRGVAVRIVLDPGERHALDRLRAGVAVRMKPPGPFMHLKSYSVDGTVLRSGSANLTASGLKQQDNDIVVIREPSAARAFDTRFEEIWAAARPNSENELVTRSFAREPARARAAAGPHGCAIKGNVSRNGERIYHMPGDPDYARTKMKNGGGKRWFCTAEEAEEAGWRKSHGLH